MTYNILIVDDDPHIIDSFELIGSELEDCKLFCFTKSNDVMKTVNNNQINLLILDIVLPDTTGYDLCREIKQHPNAAKSYCILMSADKNQLLDRIRAYKVGAQEFLHKPFDLKETELIIRSKIEYYQQNSSEIKNNEIMTVGKFIINERVQEIKIASKSISLTSLEYSLLRLFLLNPEKLIDLSEIVKEVWSDINQASFESARALIHRLRGKIEPDPKSPIYLISKKNTGYIFYPQGMPFI